MWSSVALTIIISILWLVGITYLSLALFYRLTRKEVFVPFVPSDTKGIETMCEAAAMQGTESVIDIGSGWGTILFFLATKYQKLQLTGIELNPLLHLIATIRKQLFHWQSDITLLRGDATTISFNEYDVVFIFMLSSFVNKVLVPKFEKELRPGARVVSYVFPMKSALFTEKKMEIPAHGWKSNVYIYEKKA
ncbi:hypothetical protein COZ14_01880 [Candidatus Dojkabacteria bacterium CG_4_10_14_3_um_filter_Dojkabacteria_WS6_41_9]|nr:MAG: hypothetical protein COZ14_01880 [Candidatus Dojkabacteria bacterium CG_4_10_14_3_um_filter_Dojkabacteria_WS6_41_9]